MLIVSIHWALEPFRASVQNEQHNWKTNYSALVDTLWHYIAIFALMCR